MTELLKRIFETYPDEKFVRWTDLDNAIIGVDAHSLRIIYSVQKIYEELRLQGMTEEEAREWYSYNIESTYIGERTPIHANELL